MWFVHSALIALACSRLCACARASGFVSSATRCPSALSVAKFCGRGSGGGGSSERRCWISGEYVDEPGTVEVDDVVVVLPPAVVGRWP